MAPIPAPADYRPNTARITVTAGAWVNAKEITRAFRDAQRQILAGGDAAGPMPERTLEVVRFVARRNRKNGREEWTTLWNAWNAEYPYWRYSSERYFQQTYERFQDRSVHSVYELPNYQKPEKTPHQAYCGTWLERRENGI